jgi:hypothetical protein
MFHEAVALAVGQTGLPEHVVRAVLDSNQTFLEVAGGTPDEFTGLEDSELTSLRSEWADLLPDASKPEMIPFGAAEEFISAETGLSKSVVVSVLAADLAYMVHQQIVAADLVPAYEEWARRWLASST